MPKGIPKNGINKGWFTKEPRIWAKTGVIKKCPCGKEVYCEKGKIERKKYCSKSCLAKYKYRKPMSEETKIKISQANRGRIMYWGYKIASANVGKKQSLETKEKNRISQIKRWDMVGRKTYKRYIHLCSTKQYRVWREAIFKRDNYKCSMCGEGGYLQAHHILGWTDFPEKRFDIKNGITLCLAHHPRKRAEERRLAPIFQGLISVSSVNLL